MKTTDEIKFFATASSLSSTLFLDEDFKETTRQPINRIHPEESNIERTIPISDYSLTDELNYEEQVTPIFLTGQSGFLKSFSFWLAIAIGSLAGLAFVMTVVVQVSAHFSQTIN